MVQEKIPGCQVTELNNAGFIGKCGPSLQLKAQESTTRYRYRQAAPVGIVIYYVLVKVFQVQIRLLTAHLDRWRLVHQEKDG